MGGKHKKKLRAEKSKVQLKKKTLPKGQNITDTTFKVKKIVTVEQLKKVDENEPVSNWNVPLKDLLIRCNHHNYTARLNALTGMKELLSKAPDILIGPSLRSIICKLLELLTDEEHKIRVTSIDLLSFVCELTPPDKIMPFHGIFNVFFSCAMTHRNHSIQQDSLKFVDFMLNHSPDAIKLNLKSLTGNFIRILKNHILESHTVRTGGSKQNFEQKKTEMLFKFYQFLRVGFSAEATSDQTCRTSLDLLKEAVNLREWCDQYKKVPELSLFAVSEKEKNVETDLVQFVCCGTVPLLLDTWKEFCPSQTTCECAVKEEVGQLLLVLLEIFLILYERVKTNTQLMSWFVSNYGSSFEKVFLWNFPYVPFPGSGEYSRKGLNALLKQNLIICYLSSSMRLLKKNKNFQTKMEDFLSRVLVMKNPSEVSILTKILEEILNKNQKPEFLTEVVTACSSTINAELQQSISNVLIELIFKNDQIHTEFDSSLGNWVRSLPDQLCKPKISLKEIRSILKLINQPEGDSVLLEINTKAEKIARNLAEISVTGGEELEGQKAIVNILYKCHDDVVMNILEKNIVETYSEELKAYANNVLHYRINCLTQFQ